MVQGDSATRMMTEHPGMRGDSSHQIPCHLMVRSDLSHEVPCRQMVRGDSSHQET